MWHEEIRQRHLTASVRAMMAADRYNRLRSQGCDKDDPVLLAAREKLFTEIIPLIELAQKIDTIYASWKCSGSYMAEPHTILTICGLSMQDVKVYRNGLAEG